LKGTNIQTIVGVYILWDGEAINEYIVWREDRERLEKWRCGFT